MKEAQTTTHKEIELQHRICPVAGDGGGLQCPVGRVHVYVVNPPLLSFYRWFIAIERLPSLAVDLLHLDLRCRGGGRAWP